ncbi:MAG TPA: helix-turn-helix domain-containing protein [Puia sp.]|nr:helix-turn-helix domain-containing protein [Puia sp.]
MKQFPGSVTTGKRKRSLSDPEIFKAIDEFEQAGNISTKEFAKAFQISEATVYNWRKKYRNMDAFKNQPGGFIPVDLSNVQQPEEQGRIFAEYRGIIFYQRVDPAYLKALL